MSIDDRITVDRALGYEEEVGTPRDQADWFQLHRAYDLTNVAAVGLPPRRQLMKRGKDSWPAPFRWMTHIVPLSGETRLIHVATAYGLARPSPGVDPQDILDAIAVRDDDFLTDVLELWWRNGPRTVFAALHGDIADVVETARAGVPGWADDIRNRLGLVHLDPVPSPIDIVMLEYNVSSVPRAEGLRTNRPVVAPTVLDSGLNPAFCPTPQAGGMGQTVDLGGKFESAREVIHPRPLLTASSVVGSGVVTRPVPDLAYARGLHIEWVRDAFSAANFGGESDGDIAS